MTTSDTRARRRRNLLLRSSILVSMSASGACGGNTVLDEGATNNQPPAPPFTPGSKPVDSAACDGAQAILQRDASESGYARCPDGTTHRYAALDCNLGVVDAACSGSEDTVACVADSDCSERSHGVCRHLEPFSNTGLVTVCGCIYPCESDSDCDAGKVCVCDGVDGTDGRSECRPAGCTSGDDCASAECGVSVEFFLEELFFSFVALTVIMRVPEPGFSSMLSGNRETRHYN